MTTTTKSTLDAIDWSKDAAPRGSTEEIDEVADRPMSEVVERVTEILGYDIFARDMLATGYAEYADEARAIAEASTAAAAEVLPES